MKWEYMLIIFTVNTEDKINVLSDKAHGIGGSYDFLVKKLDEFGGKGWEVAGASTDSGISRIFLKRTK